MTNAVKLFGQRQLFERGITPRFSPYINISLADPIYYNLTGDEKDIYSIRLKSLLNRFYTGNQYAPRFQLKITDEAYSYIQSFCQEIREAVVDATGFDSWMSKLHGKAIRFALAFHLWENWQDPLSKPISVEEIWKGIILAKIIAPHAYSLFSHTGLKATLDSIRILEMWKRIPDVISQNNLLNLGTTTTQIQQRTKIDRIAINNALTLLANAGWVALGDTDKGNWLVLPHFNFFNLAIPSL